MRRGKLARASRDLFQSVTLDNAGLSKLGEIRREQAGTGISPEVREFRVDNDRLSGVP